MVVAGAADADTVRATYSFVPFTNAHNSPGEASAAGDAMQMDVIEVMGFPNRVAFQFYWSGAALGAAESMFWDDEAGLLSGNPTISDSDGAGTAVTYGLLDVVLPNPEADVPSAGNIFFDADFGAANTSGQGGLARTVDQLGEWVRFDFNLFGSNTYSNVISAINLAVQNPFVDTPGGLRVALHIQSIGANNFSESFVVVPLPPAAWAGMASLVGVFGVGYIRRRSFRA